MANTFDLNFRHDLTGNMVKATRGELVCNVCQMLFAMVPGTDEYEPERGLGIHQRLFKSYVEGTRDNEYEGMIMQQLATYTEFVPTSIFAIYKEESLNIFIKLQFEENMYSINIRADKTSLTTNLVE